MDKAFVGRLLSEIIAGVIAQLIGIVLLVLVYYSLADRGIYLEPFGDKSLVLIGLLFALPISCLLAIIIMEYAIFKNGNLHLLGLMLAFISSFPVNYITIKLLDAYGGLICLVFPLIFIPTVATITYNYIVSR